MFYTTIEMDSSAEPNGKDKIGNYLQPLRKTVLVAEASVYYLTLRTSSPSRVFSRTTSKNSFGREEWGGGRPRMVQGQEQAKQTASRENRWQGRQWREWEMR